MDSSSIDSNYDDEEEERLLDTNLFYTDRSSNITDHSLKIRYKYLVGWVLTISIGMFQFGYAFSIMNQFLLTL